MGVSAKIREIPYFYGKNPIEQEMKSAEYKLSWKDYKTKITKVQGYLPDLV